MRTHNSQMSHARRDRVTREIAKKPPAKSRGENIMK
jgi:hypothetical protein